MKNLTPIKVKIGLRANGYADHPDWQKLPLAQTENPASHMFFGWKYDKTSGHKEETLDSPYGQQWGMVLVTPKFAKEAMQIFPDLVTELTETEAEDFWDNKAYKHIPENRIDLDLLKSLETELNLKEKLSQNTIALKEKIARAIDPNDDEPGVRKNKIKKFQDAKTNLGIKVVQSEK